VLPEAPDCGIGRLQFHCQPQVCRTIRAGVQSKQLRGRRATGRSAVCSARLAECGDGPARWILDFQARTPVYWGYSVVGRSGAEERTGGSTVWLAGTKPTQIELHVGIAPGPATRPRVRPDAAARNRSWDSMRGQAEHVEVDRG